MHATLEELAQGQGRRAVLREPGPAADVAPPEIVEAILDGRQPAELQLEDLLDGFPVDWAGSARHWELTRLSLAVRDARPPARL